MTRAQRYRWTFNAILFLFLGTLAYVTFKCFQRTSGHTGIDMAEIQKTRYHTQKQRGSN